MPIYEIEKLLNPERLDAALYNLPLDMRVKARGSDMDLPSRVLSWTFWNRYTKGFSTIDGIEPGAIVHGGEFTDLHGGLCPFCENWGYVAVKGTLLECLCNVMDRRVEEKNRITNFGTPVRKTTELLDTTSDPATLTKVNTMLTLLADNPVMPVGEKRRWVVLYGPPGTGKTHALRYLHTVLFPYALYIETSDYETKLYRATDTGYKSEFETAIKRTPFLLLDDWGAEYGTNYVQKSLLRILNRRYALYEENPTFIATNMTREEMQNKDMRLYDRLLETAVFVDMGTVPSYREFGGAK
jgi:DNA replication protein DnaC